MNPEGVAKRVRDAYEAYNRHDIEPYISMMAPDFAAYDPSSPEPVFRGREAARKQNEDNFKAFPDFNFKILSTAASGNIVTAEMLVSGTFKGPLELGGQIIPPSGNRFEFRMVWVARFNSEGLLTEGRNYYYDATGLPRLLGLKV
ncbi:MAG TPA: nuclear transport factor 2 family protein [Candidatus Acidoferrales bacterium]|nr:nuclear transport factor 2 family protein [Candidatus Acidoferrales bacterium]